MLVLALSAGSLLAQAPAQDLDARIQFFAEGCRPKAIVVAQVPGQIQDRAENQRGVGVRFMGEFASAPGFYYEIGGRLDSSSQFRTNGFIAPGVALYLGAVKVTDSYWSLGAAYMLQPVRNLTLGLHLEARGEALRAQGEVFQDTGTGIKSMGMVDASSTYLRPWVRASIDVTIPIGTWKPYIGADISYTRLRTTQTRLVPLVQLDERTLKSMAPDASYAAYFGLRF
jgi:hypothetical protein